MKFDTRRPPSTVQRSASDGEISSFGRGAKSGPSGHFGRFRTLHPDDKVLETSLSRRRVRDDSTRTASSDTSGWNEPGADSVDDDTSIELDDRARSVLSLLLRKEMRELVERVLTTDDPTIHRKLLGEILLASNDVLYSFGRLVADGGLTAAGGCLRTTALTDRVLQVMSESAKA